jgi:raffinose/stachyose/melibiose transport system permease protein/N-acetylglucosamine transport system permease protein
VQLFAGLVISMIPMLIIFGLAQDRITKGLSAGGLKG